MPSMRLLQFAGKAARARRTSPHTIVRSSRRRNWRTSPRSCTSRCAARASDFPSRARTCRQLPQIKKQTGKKLRAHRRSLTAKRDGATRLTLGSENMVRRQRHRFRFFGGCVRPARASRRWAERAPVRNRCARSSHFARRKILAKQGRRLSNIDVHDICCKIGEVVVAGGVRRSAP